MSEYEAQLRPSASSSLRSRVPTSKREEWTPSGIHGNGAPASSAFWLRATTRRAADAAVRACVGQEEALALEAHAERRRHDRLAHDLQVVQVSWKPSGKPTISSDEPTSIPLWFV